MHQVDGVDFEGIYHVGRILEPHGRAVEVYQQPLVRIEVERVDLVDALHEMAELRTDEGRAGVGSVHMQPNTLLLAHHAQFIKGVERAGVGRAKRRHHLQITNGSLILFEGKPRGPKHTKKGVRPAARSFLMAARRASPRRRKSASESTEHNFTPPRRPARSTDECAWSVDNGDNKRAEWSFREFLPKYCY
jgi:hypothetical protein